ncbi:unnamed protein product [Cylicostephanus goldi]|uniref:Uncharacterized protein n=1 Tax=Cylicostephanus goldi TaxID=71465 RepID=A0A3P7NRX8_CYLGO|nr:unnamed protein product [Cylicostephanus goldi]
MNNNEGSDGVDIQRTVAPVPSMILKRSPVRFRTMTSSSAPTPQFSFITMRKTSPGYIALTAVHSIKDSDRVELAEQQEAAPEHVSVETGERLPSGVEGSTTEIPEIEPKQVLENRTRTGSTPHFQKKCAVKFQARPYSKRPAESKAPFEIDVPVDSIELCATRCFQVRVHDFAK